MSESLPQPTSQSYRPYIKPFTVGPHTLRFLHATPEGQDWYDPIKPHTMLEYQWVSDHLDLTNQIVVDVGTHHGHYSLLLASMQPKQLIGIDAVQSNVDIAEVNFRLNGFTPDLRHCAVTTKNGDVQFTGESNGRVVERGTVVVPGLRLPSIAPRATVVKLDIEGEEFRVLPDQLDEMKSVHTWIIEIHPWKTRNPHELLPLLTSRFDVLWVNREKSIIEPYPKDADWSLHSTVICRK